MKHRDSHNSKGHKEAYYNMAYVGKDSFIHLHILHISEGARLSPGLWGHHVG